MVNEPIEFDVVIAELSASPVGSAMLSGRRILVVEDEPLIALDIEDTLTRAGADVRIALNVREALNLLHREGFGAAVVDHYLRGETSDPLYAELRKLGTPFVVTSGMSAPINDALVLPKPISMRRLLRVLEAAFAVRHKKVLREST